MSEKSPRQTTSIGPEALRRLGRRLMGTQDGQTPEVDPTALPYHLTTEEERRHRRANYKDMPSGPGLKQYELDWGRFLSAPEISIGSPPFLKTFFRMIDEYERDHGDKVAAAARPQEEKDNPFMSTSHLAHFMSRATPELYEWLRRNTPQNGYFTPAMVAEAAQDSPDIAVERWQEDGIDRWRFSSSNDAANNFELSQTVDGSRPTVFTEPYLAVTYDNDYDFETQEVVSIPRLGLIADDNAPSNPALKTELGAALIERLGLQEHRVCQLIDFRMAGAKPMPYFTDFDAHSMESVMGQAHVVADIPPTVNLPFSYSQ